MSRPSALRGLGVTTAARVAVAAAVAVALTGHAQRAGAQLAPVASSEGVGFRADVGPDTVYVGQQATYTLTVRIPTEVRQRLRRNPEFVPPESRALLSYDLPLTRTPASEEEAETHLFRRALFPLTPGRYNIAPARLTYAIPQSPSFFSREEERTLRSEPVALVAIEAPARGRPADWRGAVGRWAASVRADAENARVGDSFVLTLRLDGEGNAVLLPRPQLTVAWADVVPEDERIVLDSTPTLFRGTKEFSWLVTPRLGGTQTIPAIEYAYFDPSSRAYHRARAASLRVSVRAGDYITMPVRAAADARSAPLALRPTLAGPTRTRLPGGAWWIWLAALAPVPALVGATAAGVRGRKEARRHAAVRAPSPRARFGAALERRTGIVLADVTGPGALATALRLEGVTPSTAADAEQLRDAFDAQAFGRQAPQAASSLITRASEVISRINEEARRGAGALGLLLVLVIGGCVGASSDAEATRAFAEGTTAYAGGDFARARDAFRRSAAAAPRDVNAWANLGAAGWQAGDTASAVLGWQRALRLAPGDDALRARLAAVRAPQLSGFARVWPVSPLPLAVLAFVTWVGAWAWWGRRRWHGQGSGRGPRLLLVPAALLAATALWADETLRARDLAVIATPSPLLALPALGADPGAVPLVGEIARIQERRGVWLRIELGGERSGWYPAEATYALARD